MKNASETSKYCQGVIAAGLHNPQVLDALVESGGLGAILGGMWDQKEYPDRKRARKKAEPVKVKDMGRVCSYGYVGHAYDSFGGTSSVGGGITDEGLPVPVTKHMSPYAYSTFVQYDDGSGMGDPRRVCPELLMFHSNSIIRMERYDRLAKDHFGNRGHYWDQREPAAIEKFLREITEEPQMVLRRVLQGCNSGNGYPFWIFKVTPTP